MTEPVIFPIRAAQVTSAASVMAAAFADAPRFRFLVPDDAQRQTKLRWFWGASIRACIHSGGVVHVAQEGPESPILGAAIWDSPGSGAHSLPALLRSGLWAAPARLGIPAWLRRRELSSVLAALQRPRPCWYLNAIGIDPSAQRTGLGSALIERMLAQADDDALPAFLDTSAPDNLGYYERFGFRVTVESTLPNGIPLWGMTRPAVTTRRWT